MYGLQEETSRKLAGIFPFKNKFFEEGLKYLGFVLMTIISRIGHGW